MNSTEMGVKPSKAINNGPWMKLGCNSLLTHPHFAKYTPVFVFFSRFLFEASRNLTDSSAMGVKRPEVIN